MKIGWQLTEKSTKNMRSWLITFNVTFDIVQDLKHYACFKVSKYCLTSIVEYVKYKNLHPVDLISCLGWYYFFWSFNVNIILVLLWYIFFWSTCSKYFSSYWRYFTNSPEKRFSLAQIMWLIIHNSTGTKTGRQTDILLTERKSIQTYLS